MPNVHVPAWPPCSSGQAEITKPRPGNRRCETPVAGDRVLARPRLKGGRNTNLVGILTTSGGQDSALALGVLPRLPDPGRMSGVYVADSLRSPCPADPSSGEQHLEVWQRERRVRAAGPAIPGWRVSPSWTARGSEADNSRARWRPSTGPRRLLVHRSVVADRSTIRRPANAGAMTLCAMFL